MASGASLTKEQLKEQLIAHGIEAPPAKAPKASFVKLYDIHIASGHGQFSSDDEVKVKSSSGRKSKKKKISSTSMKSDESSQLSDLSNSQLAAKLKQFGVGVGPIGPTTRHVYVKKLTKLLYQESASESPTKEEYSDEDTKEEEIPSVPVTRSSSRRRTMHLSENVPQVSTRRSASGTNKRRSVAVSTVRETETFYSPEASERNSVTRRRPLRPGASQTKTPIKPDKPAQQTEQQEVRISKTFLSNKTEEDATKSTSEQQDENRLFPLWVQVLIPLAFLVFFYLVFQAMESNPNKLELH